MFKMLSRGKEYQWKLLYLLGCLAFTSSGQSYQSDEEVCGTDGWTYENKEDLSFAQLEYPDLQLLHIGPCLMATRQFLKISANSKNEEYDSYKHFRQSGLNKQHLAVHPKYLRNQKEDLIITFDNTGSKLAASTGNLLGRSNNKVGAGQQNSNQFYYAMRRPLSHRPSSRHGLKTLHHIFSYQQPQISRQKTSIKKKYIPKNLPNYHAMYHPDSYFETPDTLPSSPPPPSQRPGYYGSSNTGNMNSYSDGNYGGNFGIKGYNNEGYSDQATQYPEFESNVSVNGENSLVVDAESGLGLENEDSGVDNVSSATSEIDDPSSDIPGEGNNDVIEENSPDINVEGEPGLENEGVDGGNNDFIEENNEGINVEDESDLKNEGNGEEVTSDDAGNIDNAGPKKKLTENKNRPSNDTSLNEENNFINNIVSEDDKENEYSDEDYVEGNISGDVSSNFGGSLQGNVGGSNGVSMSGNAQGKVDVTLGTSFGTQGDNIGGTLGGKFSGNVGGSFDGTVGAKDEKEIEGDMSKGSFSGKFGADFSGNFGGSYSGKVKGGKNKDKVYSIRTQYPDRKLVGYFQSPYHPIIIIDESTEDDLLVNDGDSGFYSCESGRENPLCGYYVDTDDLDSKEFFLGK